MYPRRRDQSWLCTALVGVKTIALSLSQAFPGEKSLPDYGSQLSSQDQIKGVPFPPWSIVSDGLKIAAMKRREGSGQSREASKKKKNTTSFQPDKLCQDKTFG